MRLKEKHYEWMNELEAEHGKMGNVPEDDPLLLKLRKELGVIKQVSPNPNWKTEEKDLLKDTSLTAQEVSEQTGIPKYKVLQARQKLEVKPERKVKVWMKEHEQLFEDTSLTHQEVASKLGVSKSKVWNERKKRGIKRPVGKPKKEEDRLDVLADTTLSHKDVAKKLNLSVDYVMKLRKKHEIPYESIYKIDWTDDKNEILKRRDLTQREKAKMIGVSKSAVQKQTRKLKHKGEYYEK